jgi:hypothetical protein
MKKTKICKNCKEEKSIHWFGKRTHSADGLHYDCKSCHNEKRRKNSGVQQARREEFGAHNGVKKCQRCKVTKPIEEYTKRSNSYDGLDYQCKSCKAVENTSENSYKSKMLSRARQRARDAGLPCEIGYDDIPIPEKCPVLGIPLVFGHSEKKTAPQDDSPSIDRIVPELGYVPGNVAVISYKANLIKNKGTLEEHKLLVEWMEKQIT